LFDEYLTDIERILDGLGRWVSVQYPFNIGWNAVQYLVSFP